MKKPNAGTKDKADESSDLPDHLVSLAKELALELVKYAVGKEGVSSRSAPSVRLAAKTRLGSPHLGVADTAMYLGVSRESIRRKMRRRQIPFHERQGFRPYFLKREIDEWLADRDTLHPARDAEDQKDPECILSQEEIDRLLEGAKFPPFRK